MREDGQIQVSPRHTIRLSEEYLHFIKQAPGSDYVLRTILQREAGGMPLMTADVVIAGHETRERYPLAHAFPLHFRKTYYPGRLHGDPQIEFDRQQAASELIGIPPPIGCSPRSFRTCFVPGRPYHKLSPFGVEPEESNIGLAQELSIVSAAGLWRLLEEAFKKLETLHAGGITHGDMELHNLIVCPAPLEVLFIDFENAVQKKDHAEVWAKKCEADFTNILREAIYLQCALGRQEGSLAAAALEKIEILFHAPERFLNEMDTKSGVRS